MIAEIPHCVLDGEAPPPAPATRSRKEDFFDMSICEGLKSQRLSREAGPSRTPDSWLW